VENLFHPSVDSLNGNPDQSFTPEGDYQWHFGSYYERINRLAKVLINLSDSSFQSPALMGLAEVECQEVLEDLRLKSPLRKLDYQWVHYDSPDRRGIDVAILYRRDLLRLIDSKKIPFVWPKEKEYRSRDMLYAKFKTKAGTYLQVIICHWPSRYGGQAASEPKRLQAARILGRFCDSIALINQDPILIMGDFNDGPGDKSLSYLCDSLQNIGFENLMKSLNPALGSHRYQGNWEYLDQILIRRDSSSRLAKAQVFRADFLLEEETKFPGYKPKRAFKGRFFTTGFSDHLPIYLDYHPATQP
jgi:endonuclease/exonuclease/phosphatase family metal-dependent hydrolase